MKKLLWILVGIIAFFWLVGYLNGNSNAVDNERTYQDPWRQPTSDELVSIGQLMVKHNIGGCGEYHVKEVASQEYLIACSSDGDNWNYYLAWPRIDEIQRTNDEMDMKLTPPY